MNKGIAIPYFKSEWGMAYTQQQHQHQQQTENISARGSKSAGATSNSYMLLFFYHFLYRIDYIRIIEW